MRTNSELRQAVQHLISDKVINLDAVRAEFGEDSEEMVFAVRYTEYNSKPLAERLAAIEIKDEPTLEDAIEASKPRTTRQIIVPSPWVDMGQDKVVTINIETGEEIKD